MEQTRGGVQLRSAFLSSSLYLKTAAFLCIEISRKRTAFLCIEISRKRTTVSHEKKSSLFTPSLFFERGASN